MLSEVMSLECGVRCDSVTMSSHGLLSFSRLASVLPPPFFMTSSVCHLLCFWLSLLSLSSSCLRPSHSESTYSNHALATDTPSLQPHVLVEATKKSTSTRQEHS